MLAREVGRLEVTCFAGHAADQKKAARSGPIGRLSPASPTYAGSMRARNSFTSG